MTLQTPQYLADTDLQQRLAAALACHRRGDLEAAAAQYREILRRRPDSVDALHLLGVLHTDAGSAQAAIPLLRRAIELDAARPLTHYGLALALLAGGDLRAALASAERAIALQPDMVDAWFARGNILQQAGAFAPAIDSYRQVVQLRADFAEAHNNLAAACRGARQLPAALASVDRALALRPSYPRALNNRGLVRLDLRQGSAAIADFRRALSIEPRFPEALHNLGTALMQMRQYPQATAAFRELALLAPDFPHVGDNLMLARLNACDWTDLGSSVAALTQAVAQGKGTVAPLALLCLCDDPGLQLRNARAYTQAHFPAYAVPAAPAAHSRDRLRVAYLSGDLGEHAVTYLLSGVLERHDRTRFETFALSWGRRGEGAQRDRIEKAFSRFIDITDVADEDAARLMRDLGIDIAVDLTGHTLGQRTGILARRPAPIQVNYLGLPATMGAGYIDYLIVDRWLVPDDSRHLYQEKLVYLPGCFQPHDGRHTLSARPQPRADYGLPADRFVFCAFNRNSKMNPAWFDAAMRILAGVPGSLLWLLASHESAQDNLRREAVARGIDPARLVFAADLPYEAYLARYTAADLFLDTLPFNGGATASDALSAGIPVLTCAGRSFAARMAGSLLHTLGLPQLVTATMQDYRDTAVRLAHSPAAMEALRAKLRSARTSHPFFDADRYRVHLEEAYLAMWQRHAAGEPPGDITVAE